MPTRLLRDGILTSEAVCSLKWAAEVFYRRLMSVADDHGRFHSTPTIIRSACYPLQIDKVSDSDIGKWLTECVEAGLVRVYPASDGKRYIQIVKFGQQVRSRSRFPEPVDDGGQSKAPDNTCKQLLSNAHLDVVEVEDVLADGTSPPQYVVELPLIDGTEHGVTTQDIAEWKLAYPAVDVEQQLRAMRVWLLANPNNRKTPKGIRRFANSWLQKAQDKAPRVPVDTKPDDWTSRRAA